MQRFCLWLVGLLGLGLSCLATNASAEHILGPPNETGPVVVDIGFYLSDISGIDEENETIAFEGILTLRWKDPRQAFDPRDAETEEKFYQGDYQFAELYSGWWPQVILANESGQYERQGMMLRIAPDGSMTYIEEVDAIAEARMDLRRFPFDRQEFYAIFETLGFDRDRVILQVDETTTGHWNDDKHWIRVPQWNSPTTSTKIHEYDPVYGGSTDTPTTAFVFGIEMSRNPGYMIRLVLFPLTALVVLSWSVFWMSRSSLADRMDISFIGILTIVAYQITISGLMPKISYPTILSAYLTISFVVMCASVVVNLVIGRIDQRGDYALGDRVDVYCRFLFPLAYVLLLLGVCGTLYVRG
jgi:hypothetical protein